MDLLKLAADLFIQKIGKGGAENLSASTVTAALQGLLGGADGKLNMSDLVSKFSSGGLQGAVSSWLGNGANQPISVEQLVAALGAGPIAQFAAKLGIDSDKASEGLAATLPQVIDAASSGGNLLGGESIGKALGGLGGLFGR